MSGLTGFHKRHRDLFCIFLVWVITLEFCVAPFGYVTADPLEASAEGPSEKTLPAERTTPDETRKSAALAGDPQRILSPQQIAEELEKPVPQEEIDYLAREMVGEPLTLQQADTLGIIDSRFELIKNGVFVRDYDFRTLYGDLVDHPTLVVGKNPNHVLVKLETNAETGRGELSLAFNRSGRLFNKWKGSRTVIGTRFHDFIDFAEDENSIFALDRSGDIYMIDRVNIRTLFGKYAIPLWRVATTSIDPAAPPQTYKLQIKNGIPLTPTERSSDFRIDSQAMKEDLALCTELKDGGLFVVRQSPAPAGRSPVTAGQENRAEKPVAQDFFSRDTLLKTATAQQTAHLGMIANLNLTKESLAALQAISPDLMKEVEQYRALHPEASEAARTLEAAQALTATDPDKTVAGLRSLLVQLQQAHEGVAHDLVTYLAGNPNPDKAKTYKTFRDSEGYKRFTEVLSTVFSAPSLFLFGVMGFVMGAGEFQHLSEQYSFLNSAFRFMHQLTPMAFDPAYRPLLLKSMAANYALFQAIVTTFAVIGWRLKKSVGETMSSIGFRIYGALTFLSPGNLFAFLGVGQENVPKARAANRRRALATILAYAAIAEKQGARLDTLDISSIVYSLKRAREERLKAAMQPLEAEFERVLKSMDPVQVTTVQYKVKETLARLDAEFRREDHFDRQALQIVASKLDGALVKETDRFEIQSNRPLTQAEIQAYRGRARDELQELAEKGSFGRFLTNAATRAKAAVKRDIPRAVTTLGRDISRELLFRAEPDESVGKQSFVSWASDMPGTQFTMIPMYSGWGIKELLPPGAFQTRADPAYPEELFGQPGKLLWTHPNELTSFAYQYFAFIAAGPAQDYLAIQKGGRDIRNPYAAKAAEPPRSELYESIRKSAVRWVTMAMQPRHAGYQNYFDQRLKNIGRFFIASFWAALLFRKVMAGVPIENIPFQYLYGAFFSMWAYGWVWAPVAKGFVAAETQLRGTYEAFSSAREKLQEAIDRNRIDEPQKYAAELVRIYEDNGVRFVTTASLVVKGSKRWTDEDLALVLAQSNFQAYHSQTEAAFKDTPFRLMREKLQTLLERKAKTEHDLSEAENSLAGSTEPATVKTKMAELRADIKTLRVQAQTSAKELVDVFRSSDTPFLTLEDLGTQSMGEWSKELTRVVLAQTRARPALQRELSLRFQYLLNFIIGGGITTALAIGFTIMSFNPNKYWPTFGLKWAAIGAAIYGAVHLAFTAEAKLAERYLDPLKRRIEAYRNGKRLIRKYPLAASEVLAEKGSLDQTQASSEQQERLKAFDRVRNDLNGRASGHTCQLYLARLRAALKTAKQELGSP